MAIENYPKKSITLKNHETADQIASPLANFFKTLSDPTRLRIILAIGTTSLSVNEISTIINMSQSSVSHQLRILRDNHLVISQRFGQHIHYQLTDQHVLTILENSLDHISES
ncbi:possible transcriptional regulator [Weissella oryzae SG25]|uniref:Possible transcriptional regulator n=1 Tax=Weissella oryzae (strain DSM 25784 / JCM 18191 / LMG 30913 / SG25) TaxID=1329250 RepID=A0A069CTU6_WEIOS|nr:metalloregulator ArsR/SmtB family transcription factor [Weissella oryzae]GAK31225.1 possible transcriptional regulator [Weissella oryzae SG25]